MSYQINNGRYVYKNDDGYLIYSIYVKNLSANYWVLSKQDDNTILPIIDDIDSNNWNSYCEEDPNNPYDISLTGWNNSKQVSELADFVISKYSSDTLSKKDYISFFKTIKISNDQNDYFNGTDTVLSYLGNGKWCFYNSNTSSYISDCNSAEELLKNLTVNSKWENLNKDIILSSSFINSNNNIYFGKIGYNNDKNSELFCSGFTGDTIGFRQNIFETYFKNGCLYKFTPNELSHNYFNDEMEYVFGGDDNHCYWPETENEVLILEENKIKKKNNKNGFAIVLIPFDNKIYIPKIIDTPSHNKSRINANVFNFNKSNACVSIFGKKYNIYFVKSARFRDSLF